MYALTKSFIGPFVDLPNKENALDIERMTVLGKRLLLELRGTLVDSVDLVAAARYGASKQGCLRYVCISLTFRGLAYAT